MDRTRPGTHELGEVNAVALSPDGNRIALAGRSGALVYDRAHATSQVFHDHDGTVRSLALSRTGVLATGGDDSQIVLRDLATGTPPR
jgi:WD40 repeat protein